MSQQHGGLIQFELEQLPLRKGRHRFALRNWAISAELVGNRHFNQARTDATP